jgi:hypothetical protein
MNNNVTVSVMRSLAQQLADFWTQYIRPMPFEGVFRVGGVRVEIKVSELRTPEDTQPMKRAE